MTEDILKYADVFSAGMRVEVDLPLADEKQFRDDAKIVYFHQDLVVLQLTREVFPESAILATGTELHLRTGKMGKGYRCRAILLDRDSHSRFKIRLVGEMLPLNDREFFRIDVFIPLSYRPGSEHDRRSMKEARPGGPSREHHAEAGRAAIDALRNKPLPVAANLSGTGVRITVPERFEIDELLELTLYLPVGDSSTMTLVGRVVHVVELGPAGGPHPLYGTSLHFVSMDDSQRETLIGFIQRLQLQQISRLREQTPLQAEPEVEREVRPRVSKRRIRLILWVILLALVSAGVVLSLDHYRRNKTKGEIERTFEDQIRIILERR